MTTHHASMAVCALLALSCATPQTDSIGKALDEGDHVKAAQLASSDGEELDRLAVQILADGVEDPATSQLSMQLVSRSRSRAGDLILALADHSSDPLVQTQARALATASGVTGYEKSLMKALDSPDGAIRQAALTGLLAIRSDRAFMQKHVLDPDPQARLAVVRALVGLPSSWASDLLLEVAATDPEAKLRAAAMWGLDAGDAEHLAVLVDALDDDDLSTRLTAARVLGRTEAGVDAALAVGILQGTPDVAGIHLAAAALGAGLAVGQASDYLESALDSTSETVRVTALSALAAQRVSVPAAEALYGDSSRAVRLAWCRLDRVTLDAQPQRRISILTEAARQDESMQAMVALAEEGRYPLVRSLVWWTLETGDAMQKRYVLAHASRPFDDPSLAISAMGTDDPVVRLHAAASWLSR